MKNYRKLVPVIMIFLMVISVYYFFDNINRTNQEINGYISQGDKFYKEKLYVKAIDEYSKAKAIQSSVGIDKKIADCYEQQGMELDTERLYEDMLENYPKDVTAYEYAVAFYMRTEDYENIYSVHDTMRKRGLVSEDIEKIMAEIKYTYYMEDTSLVNVGEYFNEHCIAEIENGNKGLINSTGGTEISFSYKFVGNYASECVPVITQEGEALFLDMEENRTMNYKGEIQPEELGIFTENKYWAKQGETFVYYNAEGTQQGNTYVAVTNFNGNAAFVKENDRWILINDKFEKISDAEYAGLIIDDSGYAIRHGMAFTNEEGVGYQLTDSKGNKVSEEYYEDARLFVDGTYAAVKKDGKWGFIDSKGKMAIEPQYEDAKSFSNGLAAVKKDGKWGYINEKNETAIDFQFEDVRNFNSSMTCFVKMEDTWFRLRLYSAAA